jgi:hypothetical protein
MFVTDGFFFLFFNHRDYTRDNACCNVKASHVPFIGTVSVQSAAPRSTCKGRLKLTHQKESHSDNHAPARGGVEHRDDPTVLKQEMGRQDALPRTHTKRTSASSCVTNPLLLSACTRSVVAGATLARGRVDVSS